MAYTTRISRNADLGFIGMVLYEGDVVRGLFRSYSTHAAAERGVAKMLAKVA